MLFLQFASIRRRRVDMKKVIGILSFFFGFGLIVAIVLGFVLPLNIEITSSGITTYKLCRGFSYFLKYLPAIALTGFMVGFSVHFGRNSEGSTDRFSKAMFDRYKQVMILSIIFSFVLTMAAEVCVPLINRTQASIINRPKLINDYIKVGNNLYDNGYYERASRYADAALKLDRNSKGANTLKDKTEEQISRINTSNIRFKLYEENIKTNKTEKVNVNTENLSIAYENYKKAQAAYENEEWFNAHYYAGIALSFASSKDPNLEDIKILQTEAWNKLTQYHILKKNDQQVIFERKYEGYVALLEKNDLKAYYIFNELANTTRELSTDPDVTFYLNIAENRVREKYFFIDETFELATFEDVNDVYFSYQYKDNSQDIVYFKGMTSVKETGNSIQYLRDLTITSLDENGNFVRKMQVPYAKVLPVSVKDLNPNSKELMDIDDSVDFIPYFMLNSVGRDTPNTEIKPVYSDAYGSISNAPGYMILPVSYNDFTMFETSTNNPASLTMMSLFKLIRRADNYGFSAEVYTQTLLNRLFYAFWVLLIFLIVASFAWNTRVGTNDYFKMSWAGIFPFLIVVCWLFYEFLMSIFKLLNYAIVTFCGLGASIAVATAVYVVIFIFDTIFFLARRSKI